MCLTERADHIASHPVTRALALPRAPKSSPDGTAERLWAVGSHLAAERQQRISPPTGSRNGHADAEENIGLEAGRQIQNVKPQLLSSKSCRWVRCSEPAVAASAG